MREIKHWAGLSGPDQITYALKRGRGVKDRGEGDGFVRGGGRGLC